MGDWVSRIKGRQIGEYVDRGIGRQKGQKDRDLNRTTVLL